MPPSEHLIRLQLVGGAHSNAVTKPAQAKAPTKARRLSPRCSNPTLTILPLHEHPPCLMRMTGPKVTAKMAATAKTKEKPFRYVKATKKL